jgi:hypothetical protein
MPDDYTDLRAVLAPPGWARDRWVRDHSASAGDALVALLAEVDAARKAREGILASLDALEAELGDDLSDAADSARYSMGDIRTTLDWSAS